MTNEIVEKWIAFNNFSHVKPSLWEPRRFYFEKYGNDWKVIYEGKNYLYKENDFFDNPQDCARSCIVYNNQELGSFSLTHAIINANLAVLAGQNVQVS